MKESQCDIHSIFLTARLENCEPEQLDDVRLVLDLAGKARIGHMSPRYPMQ